MGYMTLVALNLFIVHRPYNVVKEFYPIWIPWTLAWTGAALFFFWLGSRLRFKRMAIRILPSCVYAFISIVFLLQDNGSDWLAKIIPLNAAIIATFTSAILAIKGIAQQGDAPEPTTNANSASPTPAAPAR